MTKEKKKKLTPAEREAQREARINDTVGKLRVQILTMENKKNELFQKVVEARQKGLPSQEAQARGIMRKCMAIQRQANEMLMTLELAIQSRDLAIIGSQFVECIGLVSDDMAAYAGKADFKAAEKKYLKAMYETKKQSDNIDNLLELGDYATVASFDSDKHIEFNAEIDAMLAQAEGGAAAGTVVPNKTTN